MHFEINREMRRKILIYSISLIIAILAYLTVTKFNLILSLAGKVFSLLFPFILGAGIAFVLNRPVLWFQETVFARTSLNHSARRLISTLVVFILAVLFLLLLLAMVIPNLIDSCKNFLANFADYMNTAETYIEQGIEYLSLNNTEAQSFYTSMNITETISNYMKSLIPQVAGYSISFFRQLFNFIIALASAFYILLDKKNLVHGIKVLNYSLFPKDIANYLTLFSYDAKMVFEQYIVGNLLDSLVVGLITWLGCFLFHIPYAPMIGFIVGVTNIIPVFGPFLGAVPVGIILLLIDPISALVFGIFILILQQIDGNILKPVILGDKMGLSGFWILFSVTIGGALFNIIGMFLAVPVFALIYAGIKDFAELRLEKKNITVSEEAGIIM